MPRPVPSTRDGLRRQVFGCGLGASQDSRNSERDGVVCLLGDTVLGPKARKPGPKVTFPCKITSLPLMSSQEESLPPYPASLRGPALGPRSSRLSGGQAVTSIFFK